VITVRSTPAWQWLLGSAFVAGAIPVVLAFTIHDRCSDADPGCVFHHYTTAQVGGPWSVLVLAAPLLINVMLAIALREKVTHRSARSDRLAWWFVVLSWFVCFAGLLVMGPVTFLTAALATCAVAVAPLPPDPSDPLAAPGAGYFARTPSGGAIPVAPRTRRRL